MAGTTTRSANRVAHLWLPAAALLVPALVVAEPGGPRAAADTAPVQIPAPITLPPPPPDAPPPPPTEVLPPLPEAVSPAPLAGSRAMEATPDSAFDQQVRALEERIGEAKEQVFRARARLHLLGEQVAGTDVLAGARVILVHRNEMGAAFALESVTYRIDGATVFDRVDSGGDLAKREEFEVWSGRMMPGPHTVQVMATYRGTGYGVFKYAEGYRFRTEASHEFVSEGGKATTVKVAGHEKGGITADLKDRPAVRFDVSTARDTSTRDPEARR